MVEVLGAYEETYTTYLHPINDLEGVPTRKIIGSQEKSNTRSTYSQPRIDAWMRRNIEFGNRTEAIEPD